MDKTIIEIVIASIIFIMIIVLFFISITNRLNYSSHLSSYNNMYSLLLEQSKIINEQNAAIGNLSKYVEDFTKFTNESKDLFIKNKTEQEILTKRIDFLTNLSRTNRNRIYTILLKHNEPIPYLYNEEKINTEILDQNDLKILEIMHDRNIVSDEKDIEKNIIPTPEQKDKFIIIKPWKWFSK